MADGSSGDRLRAVLADLDVESALVASWVEPLSADGWVSPTPAHGWTVAHQIAHLTWTDEAAIAATSGDPAWDALLAAAAASPATFVDEGAERLVRLPPDELVDRWRQGRKALTAALLDVPPGERIRWFGPPMKPASMATARFMETWAHGHDIAGALGIDLEPHDRVRHVCHLGVATRAFAYAVRGLEPPTEGVRVELDAPGGDTWTWGDADAADRIVGSAWDFALVAVRRLHPDDADLGAEGDAATEWLGIVQVFAGPPGADPVRNAGA